jgi:serine/threonine protein kinase
MHCGAAVPGAPTSQPVTGSIQPGRVMNKKYTILGTLGKGGMGTVYLARETLANTQRQVVIKEMLDYYDPADPQSAARAHKRFEAEAGTLVTLSYAGIPQIFDYFSESGRNYIVMQFIQGQNLESGLTHLDESDQLVRGKPFPVQQVRSWGIQLCKALEYLAGQNLVHMDIKPANLILDNSDTVWLVDFGTAKAQWVKQPGGRAGLQKSSIYGTNGYAPPEQAAGKPEARSDVYALAATMYHLLTDNHPGNNPPYTFPISNRIPANLAKALHKALATDVSKRLTAAEFRHLLTIQPAGNIPFRWRDGSIAHQPEDLAPIANLHWEEARSYFESDDWEKWFKDQHRHDLPDQLKRVKSQTRDTNLALDAFLRFLDPSFPPPQLRLNQPSLNAGVLPWRSRRTFDLEIVNSGSGCLNGGFPNLPPCLQIEPAVFSTHNRQAIRVTLDASMLSPGPRPQTTLLTIDAGQGGIMQIPISFSVPEPHLQVSLPSLDLGSAYQGEAVAGSITVSNSGASPFIGNVTVQAGWLNVEPPIFLCPPGSNLDVQVIANTQGLSLGKKLAQLEIKAKANQWEQPVPVQVALNLSTLRTFLKFWAPPIVFTLVGALYGFCFGWMLGWLGETFELHLTSNLSIFMSGAVVGGVTCAVIGALVGALSGIGNLNTRDSALAGALLAGLLGVVIGGASGFLWRAVLNWLGILVNRGDLLLYAALVGILPCALLFWILWSINKTNTP